MGCRPLKFPNLIVLLTRFGHVLEGSPPPPGSIWRRPRRLVIEIWQIWGWVSAPVAARALEKFIHIFTTDANRSMARPRNLYRRVHVR